MQYSTGPGDRHKASKILTTKGKLYRITNCSFCTGFMEGMTVGCTVCGKHSLYPKWHPFPYVVLFTTFDQGFHQGIKCHMGHIPSADWIAKQIL